MISIKEKLQELLGCSDKYDDKAFANEIRRMAKKRYLDGDELNFVGVYVTDFGTVEVLLLDDDDVELIRSRHTTKREAA